MGTWHLRALCISYMCVLLFWTLMKYILEASTISCILRRKMEMTLCLQANQRVKRGQAPQGVAFRNSQRTPQRKAPITRQDSSGHKWQNCNLNHLKLYLALYTWDSLYTVVSEPSFWLCCTVMKPFTTDWDLNPCGCALPLSFLPLTQGQLWSQYEKKSKVKWLENYLMYDSASEQSHKTSF